MFRIIPVFESRAVSIVKVAGQVADADRESWSEFLSSLKSDRRRWLVLEFSDLSRIAPLAAQDLVQQVSESVLVLNCPASLQNMLVSAGFRDQVLDVAEASGSGPWPSQCFLELAPQARAAAAPLSRGAA